MSPSHPVSDPAPACAVYFDGSCPLCRAEIDLYRRIGTKALFYDVAAGDALPPGVDRDSAVARFHVTAADGTVQSGARAFATLWQASPGAWHLLGRVVALRPFLWIAEAAYRVFLLVRSRLQRARRARQAVKR